MRPLGDTGNALPAESYDGIAGAIPVESVDPSMNDPRAYATLRPRTMLSFTSPLVALAASGTHHQVTVDALALRRLMAWVNACCPFLGDEEVRALGNPDFPGIDELPIRPRVRSAPVVSRP